MDIPVWIWWLLGTMAAMGVGFALGLLLVMHLLGKALQRYFNGGKKRNG